MKIDTDISDAANELGKLRHVSGGLQVVSIAQALQQVRNDARKAEREQWARLCEDVATQLEPGVVNGSAIVELRAIGKRIRKGKP